MKERGTHAALSPFSHPDPTTPPNDDPGSCYFKSPLSSSKEALLSWFPPIAMVNDSKTINHQKAQDLSLFVCGFTDSAYQTNIHSNGYRM